ncbi:phage portal protein [Actinophytocola sp. NPDC049390]|uniref:phage portal protein n=1 Tax=Actinophytocola sp. NPDC049390 TaxID=3363894 RepID=UPI003795A0F2
MGWSFWRRSQKRSAPQYSISDPRLAEYLGLVRSAAGVPVNENTALTLSALYRACSLIAGTVASLSLRSLRTTSDDMREQVKSWLDTPNGPEGMTQFEWVETVVWHLVLQGNAFLLHLYNGAGALAGAFPVHPNAVTVEWDEERPGGKKFTVTLDDGSTREYDASTMTQIMGPSLDGLRGMSLVERARNGIGTGLAGDESAARMFRDGALISGLVTPDEDVTPDEAQEMKDDLQVKVLGAENAGTIAFINRKLKFEKWSLSAVDAQFLESRQFQIEEISRWTGVPPHLLMQTEKATSWGTGIGEQNRGLRQFTLLGWTRRIEQRLSRLLPGGQIAEFDFASLERPSPEDEINLLIAQVNAGLLTLNEARRIRNMPPLSDPSADLPRVPPGSVAPTATPEPTQEGEPNGNGDV